MMRERDENTMHEQLDNLRIQEESSSYTHSEGSSPSPTHKDARARGKAKAFQAYKTTGNKDLMLTLTIRTIEGEEEIGRIPSGTSVSELLDLIHSQGQHEGMEYPSTVDQRVIFQGKEIKDCTLEQAGVENKSVLLIVKRRRPLECLKSKSIDHAVEVTPELINSMTQKLAERKGYVNKSDATNSSWPHERAGLTSLHQHLLSVLSGGTISGSTAQSLLFNMDLGSSSENTETSSVLGEQGNLRANDEEDEESNSSRERAEPVSSDQLPQANPERLQQLVEMGFAEPVASKALILRHNNMEAAMDWLLEHGDDPDASTPLTESQLERIALLRRRGRRSRVRLANSLHNIRQPVDSSLVNQLSEMGFSESRARFALQTFHNNLELACQWLIANSDDFESGEDADGGEDESAEILIPASNVQNNTAQPGNLINILMHQGQNSERLMQAFQVMRENPREARSYLTDPEIGPILLQIQRAQRISSGASPAESNQGNLENAEN